MHGKALLGNPEANIYSSARQCSAGLSWITKVNMRVEEDIATRCCCRSNSFWKPSNGHAKIVLRSDEYGDECKNEKIM